MPAPEAAQASSLADAAALAWLEIKIHCIQARSLLSLASNSQNGWVGKMNFYAHTSKLGDGSRDSDERRWQPLATHLRNVAELAANFAGRFGMGDETPARRFTS